VQVDGKTCFMDSSQYNNDSFMLFETCLATIDLLILQGFHVKQWDIYGNNYYP
jgi:hypothetical protein